MRVSKHNGKIPEAQRDQVFALYWNGFKPCKIASELRIHRNTVSRILSPLRK